MAKPFRRTGLFWIPAILLAVVVAPSLLFRAPAIAFYGVVASAFALVHAIVESAKKVEVTPDSVTQSGYFGGPQVVRSSEVVACKYRRFVPLGRAGFLLNILQIVGANGKTVMVSRGAWGRRRRDLFGELANWLARNGVEVGARERAFLES
jgi:hypothetical protein